MTAADGKTKYALVPEVLRRARTPDAGSGEEQATPLTLEIIQAQAARCLEKMHCKRIALADKLSSQGGVNAFGANADAHERTKRAHQNNDSVENKFSSADFCMRTYRHISVPNVSGMVQQRTAHDFDQKLLIVSDRRKRKVTSESQVHIHILIHTYLLIHTYTHTHAHTHRHTHIHNKTNK